MAGSTVHTTARPAAQTPAQATACSPNRPPDHPPGSPLGHSPVRHKMCRTPAASRPSGCQEGP
eukprot:3347619-Alexandrium_andersonii.AAC.1